MKKILCATYEGIDAKVVDVESTLTKGLPSFSVVGMASTSINESKEFLITGELELFSYQIQDAIRAISEITKPFEYDEMLDKMFGSFCVGK